MTGSSWTPEVRVDEGLVTRLLAAQFPEFRGQSLKLLGEGWCNRVFEVGSAVFRFPQRSAGARGIRVETAVLPKLSERISVGIPQPLWIGEATEDYPFSFYGHPKLEGETGDRCSLRPPEESQVARQLGEFLRELHAIPLDWAREVGAPDGAHRADIRRRLGLARGALERLSSRLPRGLVSTLEGHLDPGEVPEPELPPVLFHGDLYARHLVFGADRRLSGILDWEDLGIGARSTDLCLAFGFLSPAARPEFWEAYGEVSKGTRRRAEVLAWTYPVFLLEYALDVSDPSIGREMLRSLSVCLGVSEEITDPAQALFSDMKKGPEP